MLKPVKRDNKKPYSSPILTVHGTVQELTQKIGTRRTPDSVRRPTTYTHT